MSNSLRKEMGYSCCTFLSLRLDSLECGQDEDVMCDHTQDKARRWDQRSITYPLAMIFPLLHRGGVSYGHVAPYSRLPLLDRGNSGTDQFLPNKPMVQVGIMLM